MKLLFISRAYPPVLGGIENHNFELAKRFQGLADTTLLVNTRGKKFLPFFLPYALLKTLFIVRRYDVVLLGDGVLGAIGFFAKAASRKTLVASVIHGLDITYKNPLYQFFWVQIFLPSLDRLIAVSEETKNTAIQYGLEEKKITVIPNGVATAYEPERYSREQLSEILGFDAKNKKILLTHGRLAKRKGVEWFIKNVLPLLPEEVHYVISGDGPERQNIEEAIKVHGLEARVTLLGRISDEVKLTLLHTIDIFLQPNISVPGDMEGFGIAIIEATSCARPVVASNIEGIKDAIAGGENGFPLPSGDTKAWRDTLHELLQNPEELGHAGQKFRRYTQTNFSWDVIAQAYQKALSR